jgi:lambda family phage portal protein
MYQIQMLKGLDEASLVQARIQAASMGFFKRPTDTPWTGGEGSSGEPEYEVEPGIFKALPPGWEFQGFDPAKTDSYAPFSKSIKEQIAAGLGISYPTLTGDLSSVNFSSIRAGNLQDQEYFKSLQRLIVERLVIPIFEGWLETQLVLKTLGLPFEKYDKFNSPTWTCKRWAYVNPTDEASANETLLANGLISRTQLIEQLGGDITEVFQQLKREQELAAQLGISLSPVSKQQVSNNGKPNKENPDSLPDKGTGDK